MTPIWGIWSEVRQKWYVLGDGSVFYASHREIANAQLVIVQREEWKNGPNDWAVKQITED